MRTSETMASVKVAVRVRPFNKRELAMNAKLVVQIDGKRTRIYNTKAPSSCRDIDREQHKDFTFDHSYWSFDDADDNYASQEEVYYDLGTEVVESAFEGYNACVFAYGQTGSGKTYTMMGSAESQGLIPRICKTLFSRMAAGKETGASYRTEVSFLEIHNERVKDLLRPDQTISHSLRVREHPKRGPYVQDLSSHLVYDYSDIQECMVRGNTHRTTASTNMNDVSSRSHAIFTITFVQAGFSANNLPSETVSKVHLVDLAGSERANATGATGQRLKEGAHINKSLVTLGSVISALAELSSSSDLNASRRNSIFIPYRDSVLTWLLKDSLGGNSKTIMIAAISPADCNYGETLSTLRYANRAKNIINKPTINEDPNVKLIRELRDEILKLKSLISKDVSIEKPQVLLAQIHEKQEQEKVLTEEWTEKWRETQKILHEQRALGLRKSGVGVVLDSEMPHLVGIDDDLLSTGVTLYHLKEGKTLVGTEEAPTTQDIVLTGGDVEPEHCIVELESGVATLHPLSPHCWLNSAQVDKPMRLSQGCIILLGRNNMFRYNDPVEAAKLRKEGGLGNGNLQSTVVNLSRLSLLSWSVSDLHSSSDNLLNSSEDLRALEELEQQKAALVKEKEEFKKEQEEREERWTARREALEEAQRELEREWGAQWREWAEGIAALERRQRELRMRRQLLEQERRDEMTQTDDGTISDPSLPESNTSLNDDKYDTNKSEDNSNKLSHFKEIAALKLELKDKMKILNNHQSKIDKMDEELISISEKQKEINNLNDLDDTDKKLLITSRSPEEMQEILRRKRSLSLNLKRALPAFYEDESIVEDQIIKTSDNEIINRKKKIAAALNLMYPDLSSPIDTTETFHTAADTPDVRIKFSEVINTDENESKTSISNNKLETEIKVNSSEINGGNNINDIHEEVDINGENAIELKSPAEEIRELNKIETSQPEDNESSKNDNNKTLLNHSVNSFSDNNLYNDLDRYTILEESPAMKCLNEKITKQRSVVMKCLEDSPASKDELNRQICILQDLQRQQIELEVSMMEQEKNGHVLDDSIKEYNISDKIVNDCENPSSSCNNDYEKNNCELSKRNSVTSSTISLANSTLLRSHMRSSQTNEDEINSRNSTRTPQNRYSSVYLSSQNRGDRLMSPYTLTIARSLPSLIGNENNSENIINIIISVPSYVIRGAGTSSHYEYEVRVVVVDDSWTLLRRYRRFRELYSSMRQKYGSKVSGIRFPPRQMFAKYEVVARQRRKRLEEYLRNLILTCSELPNCEPLYKFRNNMSNIDKQSLLEFHSFFRRGTFESSKYGTS